MACLIKSISRQSSRVVSSSFATPTRPLLLLNSLGRSMTTATTGAFWTRQSAIKCLTDWKPPSNCLLQPMTIKDSTTAPEGQHDVHDPTTGDLLFRFTPTSSSELDRMVEKARQAQREWAKVPLIERTKIMLRVADLVRRDLSWLAQIESLNTGTPVGQTRGDISDCADVITMYGGLVQTLTGQHTPVPPDCDSFYYTRREPYGICSGIGAWNFPFQIAVWKSAPALAAGNAFLFKPAPSTPLTALRLGQLYSEAGCPDGLYSAVLGDIDVGQALIHHPGVAKISFTGSTRGGIGVATAAASRVIPATMELGGKSALIIMSDANLDEAVKGALLANFLHTGQVCSNASRVFVHRSIADQFRTKLIAAVKALKVGDPFEPGVAVGPMTLCHQLTSVNSYVESAVKQGAIVLTGGDNNSSSNTSVNQQGNFIWPVVLDKCRDDMTAVREEIFGPVLTLLEFDSEDEVVERANNSNLGLAGGCFTQDLTTAHRIAARLECGSVYINSYNWYAPGMPFGGFKQSGFGRENCTETLLAHTQLKSIYVQGSTKLDNPFP